MTEMFGDIRLRFIDCHGVVDHRWVLIQLLIAIMYA